MHRANSDDAFTQTWFDKNRSIFPLSSCNKNKRWTCERASVPVRLCVQNPGFFQPEEWFFQKAESLNKPQKRKVQCRWIVSYQRIWNEPCACDPYSRDWQFTDKRKSVGWKLLLGRHFALTNSQQRNYSVKNFLSPERVQHYEVRIAWTPKQYSLWRKTAREGCPDPENVKNHMIAPQDYDAF